MLHQHSNYVTVKSMHITKNILKNILFQWGQNLLGNTK